MDESNGPDEGAQQEPSADSATKSAEDPVRLAALRATGLLDTDIEEVFDRLTRLAVRLLGVPAAYLTLVDAKRDFYKSQTGFPEPVASARQLTGLTFCQFTSTRTTPLIVGDASSHPVYGELQSVREFGVGAYLGVPIVVTGQTIGAFCALDMKPHPWTADEVEVMVELAAASQREIELRMALEAGRAANEVLQAQFVELERSQDELRRQAVTLQAQEERSGT